MDAKETVRRLLEGSHNIDRMRTEIEEMVGMLVGFVMHSNNFDWETIGREFESGVCVWKLKDPIHFLVSSDKKVCIECLLNHGNVRILVFSSDIPLLKTNHVQFVHDHLHILVEGLIKAFPELQEKWRPLIDASAVSFKA